MGLAVGSLHHGLLENELLLLEVLDVWLDLLEEDQAQGEEGLVVEVFLEVLGSLDEVKV